MEGKKNSYHTIEGFNQKQSFQPMTVWQDYKQILHYNTGKGQSPKMALPFSDQ